MVSMFSHTAYAITIVYPEPSALLSKDLVVYGEGAQFGSTGYEFNTYSTCWESFKKQFRDIIENDRSDDLDMTVVVRLSKFYSLELFYKRKKVITLVNLFIYII